MTVTVGRFRPVDSREYLRGSGTDETAAFGTLLTAGAGKLIHLYPAASGEYLVSAAIAMATAKTRIVCMPGTVVRQTTKYLPVFDVSADEVVIEGLHARWTGSRAYTGGGSPFRGDDPYNYGAAIWSNGNRGVFRNIRAYGFTSGIYLSAWNGSTLAPHSKVGNVVDGLEIDQCDFGLLFCGQVDLSFTGVRGTYTLQTSSPNPPHLVYGSDGAANRNVTGGACNARDGANGHAYQFKDVDGGTLDGLVAYACPGWLSTNECHALRIAGSSQGDLGSAENGSLYMQGADTRCRIEATIDLATGARIARVDGTDNVLVLDARQRRASNTDNYDVTVQGARNEVDASVVNVQQDGTDYTTGGRCIGLLAGSGHRARVRQARNTKFAVTIALGVTGCSVEVDPRRITRASSLSADSIFSFVETASTRVAPSGFALQAAITGAGTTVRPDAGLYDRVLIRVDTADNFTVQSPYTGGVVPGMRLLVLIHNNSGGAMGTITWTGFTLASAWSNPGSSVRHWIEFAADDSGTYREIARSF